MYGNYGLRPGEKVKFIRKENGRILTKIVEVVKEYPYFVLVEITGKIGNFQTCINKSWIYAHEAKLKRV